MKTRKEFYESPALESMEFETEQICITGSVENENNEVMPPMDWDNN